MQEITCGSCANQLSVPPELVGKPVRCPYCKTRVDVSVAPTASAAPQQPPWDEEDDYRPRRRRSRGTGNDSHGTTALVLGILAIPLCFVCGIFGAPLAVLAIVFGNLGLKGSNRGPAMAGLILGIIALAVMVLMIALNVALRVNNGNLGF